ncbi:hypothetical protein EHS25_002473 [Saitozyma podzolica]|uniref:Uncharacterized protein n=1 Tax=Saitozyma podzolica TaxID=1890683 RepID=A0A427YDW3_9TREE|nr:hypothetical protein EHS25_002473 [Saitozyma podzolica]
MSPISDPPVVLRLRGGCLSQVSSSSPLSPPPSCPHLASSPVTTPPLTPSHLTSPRLSSVLLVAPVLLTSPRLSLHPPSRPRGHQLTLCIEASTNSPSIALTNAPSPTAVSRATKSPLASGAVPALRSSPPPVGRICNYPPRIHSPRPLSRRTPTVLALLEGPGPGPMNISIPRVWYGLGVVLAANPAPPAKK